MKHIGDVLPSVLQEIAETVQGAKLSKVCLACRTEFSKPPKISLGQWSARAYCSYACARAEHAKKIRRAEPTSVDEVRQRFFGKVTKTDGCWLWLGARGDGGYGVMRIDGRIIRATHVSWFLHRGIWTKLWMLHSCDNPQCVRPDHLQEGDHAGNMRQMVERGRAHGAHGRAN